jgi:hypothetical protein
MRMVCHAGTSTPKTRGWKGDRAHLWKLSLVWSSESKAFHFNLLQQLPLNSRIRTFQKGSARWITSWLARLLAAYTSSSGSAFGSPSGPHFHSQEVRFSTDKGSSDGEKMIPEMIHGKDTVRDSNIPDIRFSLAFKGQVNVALAS